MWCQFKGKMVKVVLMLVLNNNNTTHNNKNTVMAARLLCCFPPLSNCPETSLGVVSYFGSTYNFFYAAICVWIFRFQLCSHGIVNPKQSVGSVGLFPKAIPPFFFAVCLLAPRKLSSGLEPVGVGTVSPKSLYWRAPRCLLLYRGSFGCIF